MANINVFIFIALGIVLGGTFVVSCIYVTCKLCSEYMYGNPLKSKDKQSTDETAKMNTEKIPCENYCEDVWVSDSLSQPDY